MKYYKLKKEARQFFKENLAEEVRPIEFWDSQVIHQNLLDECGNVVITYGKTINDSQKDLKGWSSQGEHAKINFAVNVFGISNDDYKSLDVIGLMDALQECSQKFIKK